jgi:hypothetical protein
LKWREFININNYLAELLGLHIRYEEELISCIIPKCKACFNL